MAEQQYRLVTRSDFDGLVCAVLLKELQLIDDILFVHPKDMQDGKIDISERDITTNLPYVEGCHLSFDHHASELKRRGEQNYDNHIIDEKAFFAAVIVIHHPGGGGRF
ncbi:MAG: exopolyphosphatase, partial [Pseudomonadota bacterium]